MGIWPQSSSTRFKGLKLPSHDYLWALQSQSEGVCGCGASDCLEGHVLTSRQIDRPFHIQRLTIYGPGINASSFAAVASHTNFVVGIVYKRYVDGYLTLKRILAASDFDGKLTHAPLEHGLACALGNQGKLSVAFGTSSPCAPLNDLQCAPEKSQWPLTRHNNRTVIVAEIFVCKKLSRLLCN